MNSTLSGLRAGKIWSLLELMRKADISFVAAHSAKLAVVETIFREHGHGGTYYAMHHDGFEGTIKQTRELAARLTALNFGVSAIRATRFVNVLLETQEPYPDKVTFAPFNCIHLSGILNQLIQSMEDELASILLFSVTVEERQLLEPPEPLWGAEFEAKFPSAQYDLEQAARCMAFSLSTATVFHLMRVTEIGLRAVARCLQIPDPVKPGDRNWGNVLKRIKEDGYELKWPTAALRSHGDGAFFESLYASLDAVKNAWRNTTMHIENKYTPDEARHIYEVVSGLMKKIASRLDEAGNPQA